MSNNLIKGFLAKKEFRIVSLSLILIVLVALAILITLTLRSHQEIRNQNAGTRGPSVTTKTGVITHGSIVTTSATIGWLLKCKPSHSLRDDPIVHPGQPGASHLHDFWGNASTNANSTLQTQEASSNNAIADTYNKNTLMPGTSCDLTPYASGTSGDTASYWTPALFANGQRIIPFQSELYYRANPTFGTGFKPFPTDARLLVGNHMAMRVTDNDAIMNGHLYWFCHGDTSHHFQIPPTTCTELVLIVFFPNCYDNGPMDHTGPGHSDNEHFAYSVDGVCPAGFPTKIPELSARFKYSVPAKGMQFLLSSGPTSTAHADFWNTWNPVALKFLVDKCINAGVSCGTNPIVPLH